MATNNGSRPSSFWPKWEENTPFALMLLILGAFLIVLVNAKISQAMKETGEIGRPQPIEHQISVEGEGRAIGTPDIATITLGVDTKADEVAAAQDQNTATVNALIDKIKALGVPEEDIQTSSYNVYENTVWNPDTQEYDSKGWVVSQQLTVKVRDTGKISSVLEAAGKSGVTNIYGPNFTIDDQSALKDEAREEAIADAEEKAAQLAAELGVKLERVVGYSEWLSDGVVPYYGYEYGGAGPAIEAGSTELKLTVSITYKLAE